jgi:peptidoglycan/xylan/chitin deacetylase (PgdA/CDA1 family)
MELLSVNYHYIRDKKYKNGIYPVSRSEFINDLDNLGKNYEFISQSELSNRIVNKDFDNKKYVLITFDDGLKEQMDAVEIMEKKGIPGVFYVTTDSIEKGIVVDVHKLHYIRSILNDEDIFNVLDKEYSISSFVFDEKALSRQYRYDNSLAQRVKYYINFIMSKREKKYFIDKLFKQIIENESDFSLKLYMEKADLIKLDKLGMLGVHSASHTPLATLSNEEINEDIKRNIDFFSSLGIKKNTSISYPYGSKSAVNEKVADISSSFGFTFGLTMYRGINRESDFFNNPMLLKRISCSDLLNKELISKF